MFYSVVVVVVVLPDANEINVVDGLQTANLDPKPQKLLNKTTTNSNYRRLRPNGANI